VSHQTLTVDSQNDLVPRPRDRGGLPKHCSWNTDRHGKRRVRFRRNGFSTYLKGTPWSEEFMRECAPMRRLEPPAPRTLPLPPPAPRLVSNSKAKYIYVIGHAKDGPVKIGVSTKPRARLRELQTGNRVKTKNSCEDPR
jgi:hypothetical protein